MDTADKICHFYTSHSEFWPITLLALGLIILIVIIFYLWLVRQQKVLALAIVIAASFVSSGFAIQYEHWNRDTYLLQKFSDETGISLEKIRLASRLWDLLNSSKDKEEGR